MARKHSRRMSKKHRTHKRRHHRMRGGDSTPSPVTGSGMAQMAAQSLAQGQQFASMHANQHGGGGLDAGPFPGAVTEESMLPSNLQAAARVAPLNAALNAIANMKDPGQAGGGRKRKGSKKSRKGSKKSRKGSKKSRKGAKKGRKGSRKMRRTRRMRGGAAYDSNPASVNAPGMLLSGSQMSKALSGMNSEWKLAEDPSAFAPGVAKNY
jgi:transcription factor SPN1